MIDISTLTKRYYTITEVSEMFDVNKSLLRYWEGEFKEIKPRKDRGGIRRYTAADITILNRIYDLVKVRGFTIDGARKELLQKTESTHPNDIKATLQRTLDRLKTMRSELDEL